MLINTTIDEIHKRILDNIGDQYDKTTGYITSDISKSLAIEEYEIYSLVNKVYDGLDVEKLSGDDLERFIYQRKGINRKAATHATGVINIVGNGSITKGDLFETAAGTQFKAIEDKTIISSGDVKIQSVLSGQVGNVAAETITKLPISINGIESVNNYTPTTGGYEAESDGDLLERYYLALKTPPTSGNKYHYLMWAKEIEGVGDAKVYPLDEGANTVTVIIIDADKKEADGGLIEKVQNYIDPASSGRGEGQAPIGAKCYVKSATAMPITVSLNLTVAGGYEKDNVKAAIELSIKEYLKEIAFKQNYLSYARLGSLIFDVDGVEDYTDLKINDLSENVTIEDRQVMTLGGVTIV